MGGWLVARGVETQLMNYQMMGMPGEVFRPPVHRCARRAAVMMRIGSARAGMMDGDMDDGLFLRRQVVAVAIQTMAIRCAR